VALPQSAPAPRRENIPRLADAKRRGDPEFSDFQLAQSPLYLIVRTAGRYAQELENALNASGMDLLSWRALMIVNEVSPSSVSEIAERSVTRLSTMTRVVQRLEKKNLVTLSKRRSDARVTEVHLTPLGKRCVERPAKYFIRGHRRLESAHAAYFRQFVALAGEPSRPPAAQAACPANLMLGSRTVVDMI